MIPFLTFVALMPLGTLAHDRWQAAPSVASCAVAAAVVLTQSALLLRLRANPLCTAGAAVFFAGAASNAAAELLNGGRMPVLGMGDGAPDALHMAATVATRAPWLVDRFWLHAPDAWPVGIFSAGDVLVVLGLALLCVGVTWWLHRHVAPLTVRDIAVVGVTSAVLSLAGCGPYPGPAPLGMLVGQARAAALHAVLDVRHGAAQTVRSLTLPPAHPDTLAAIRAASEAYRLDPFCMAALANTLSTTGRDPRAYAPGVASVGLYRITPATWLWASAGQYGHTLPLEAREDDRLSAWVAAYVMDLSGAQHWRAAGARDCRLYGEHGPPPWDSYRAGAHPYSHWVSDYWVPVSYEQEFAAAERQWLRTCAEERTAPWANALAWRCADLWAQWDAAEGGEPS